MLNTSPNTAAFVWSQRGGLLQLLAGQRRVDRTDETAGGHAKDEGDSSGDEGPKYFLSICVSSLKLLVLYW